MTNPAATTAPQPLTLAELRKYLGDTMLQPETTADAHKAMYARARASAAAILDELKKLTIAKLEPMAGRSAGEKKASVVRSAWHNLLRAFAVTDMMEFSFHDKFEDVIDRYVAQVTDAALQERRELRAETKQKYDEAKANADRAAEDPQTVEDFRICIRRRGIAKLQADNTPVPRKRNDIDVLIFATGITQLTDAELERYDNLMAALGQERRAKELVERATIKRIEIGEGNYMEIAKVFHTKRESWQWIVVLAEREDRTTFEELCIAARKLGGNYQRAWAPTDSPGGFAFDDEGQAKKFVEVQSRDVFEMARLERLCANRDRVRNNAVAHFEGLGDRMIDRATESLERPRRENTDRQITHAENARDSAREDLAMAGTLHATAVALSRRLAVHTDRIRWRTHAEAFDAVLARAQGRMAAVQYPWPVVGVHTLLEIAQQIGERDGSKLISQRIVKLCREATNGEVHFHNTYLADTLRHFYRRARLHRVRGWSLDSVRYALGDFKRVRLMGLDTLPELRAALREHLGRRVEVTEFTRAEQVMRNLFPTAFPPDYFPTPRDVVEIMLDYAGIDPGESFEWLEPEAGSAHIANVVRELFPNSKATLIELSGLLCQAITAQGHVGVVNDDFLQIDPMSPLVGGGNFDYVIMNPPFGCDGVGTDIDHVLHAFKFLRDPEPEKRPGRLVSLMSEGVFYRNDNKTQEFRSWLEYNLGGSFELPEGAFLNSDRPTSWAARVVVVDKLPTEVLQDAAQGRADAALAGAMGWN